MSVKLSKPVSLAGVTLTSLDLREPTLRDLRECSIDPATLLSTGTLIMTGKGGLTTEQVVKLSARLSGQSEALIDECSARDLLEIHDALLDFFSLAEEDSAGPGTPTPSDAP